MTTATSKAVAAGQSARSEDLLLAANLGRQATHDLLFICKGGRNQITDRNFQQRLMENGRNCVKYYQEFLKTIHQFIEQPSNEVKQDFLQYSRRIAQTIQELAHCAEQWKSLQKLFFLSIDEKLTSNVCFFLDFDLDDDDSTTFAEDELFNAAQSIETAAKKLSNLKPRRTVEVIFRGFIE